MFYLPGQGDSDRRRRLRRMLAAYPAVAHSGGRDPNARPLCLWAAVWNETEDGERPPEVEGLPVRPAGELSVRLSEIVWACEVGNDGHEETGTNLR